MRLLGLLLGLQLVAGLVLPSFFASHMVVQQDRSFVIWGADTPFSTIRISFLGRTFQNTTNNFGYFRVTLPATPATAGPTGIRIESTATTRMLVLDDVVFGDVYVCSGQSNMQLAVIESSNATHEIPASSLYGSQLRLFQVNLNPEYENTTFPQQNLTASVPWSWASPQSVPWFSAVCYFHGVYLVDHFRSRGDRRTAVGVIASSWGGTTLEVWTPPQVIIQCTLGLEEEQAGVSMNEQVQKLDLLSLTNKPLTFPTRAGVLFNSMINPLLVLPIKGLLWYQGEGNAGNPIGYSRCFPAMIRAWREAWFAGTNGQTDINLPFIFVQISSWVAGDVMVPIQRYAQQAALTLPKVGMVVAADIGDPASPVHPIHPVFKREVARRAFITGQNIVYGNSAAPASGPLLLRVTVDRWNQNWGDYYFGMGTANICASFPMFCGGIRLTFDQPIVLRGLAGGIPGPMFAWPNGFEVQATDGSWYPISLFGVRQDDPRTIQLNTSIPGAQPVYLRYGWRDYPSMPLANMYGQPTPPFNVTIPR